MAATGDRITRRKDGLYMGRYTVQTPDGPKRKTIYGKRYRDVEKQLNEARANADQGLIFDAGKLTTADYLDRWLADSVKDTVRTRTYERYESLVRVHISPALGRVKLKNVTPAHIRGLYREKLEAGLAPRTVQYIHRTLSKALKQAVMDGMIPRNAAAAVQPPQARKEEIQPLSREQVWVFLDTVSGDRLEALYVVAISAGLRQGELLGLKWEDLDLDAGILQVRRTLSETRDGRVFEPPKSGKGRRIRLTKRAVAALRSHRARQAEEKLRLGTLWQENGLVFASEAGTPIGGRNLIRHYKIRLERAGLGKKFRFHDLRHTCATLLLRQGVHVKFVQELLGHGDVALTLNVYSHVLPDMGDAAAGAMDDALG
jgi:integrase